MRKINLNKKRNIKIEHSSVIDSATIPRAEHVRQAKVIKNDGERTRLFLEIEFLGQRSVSLWILLFQIIQMSLSIGYHREKTASGMVVLLVFLEMARQFCDFLSQNRYLNLRRTGVLIVNRYFLDNFCLLSCCKHVGDTIARLYYYRKSDGTVQYLRGCLFSLFGRILIQCLAKHVAQYIASHTI